MMESTNNTTNYTLDVPLKCFYLDLSTGAFISKLIGYSLLILFSSIGNICIIILTIRTKQERGAMDIFILNMAFSDLSVPFVIGPKSLYEVATHTEGLWQLRGKAGDVLCKLTTFLVDISPIVSSLTLCCITIERFLAIVRPQISLQSNKTKERMHFIMSAVTWIIAIGFCAPYFKYFKLTEYDDVRADCEYSFDNEVAHRAYTITACILFIVLPTVLMATMYTLAIITLKRSNKRMSISLTQVAKHQRSLRMRTVLKLSIAVVLGFFLCWGPWNVGVFLLTFSWGWSNTNTCAFKYYWFFASFMSLLNAATNPWTYLLLVERFKRQLRKAFRLSVSRIIRFLPGRTGRCDIGGGQ
ncbi:neuropeptide Y receptor type 1 [Exaiptasia diaphana]|uniref:G-protein coupled receptors family 1 profile domain-containing protein n=1 Tax=Exaiptasia diaphana TaxID=2652724 RepID=A0A913YEE1_EXADI|nr:neuropeptide Y receptor type 1 [Exaiptasia diaphana]